MNSSCRSFGEPARSRDMSLNSRLSAACLFPYHRYTQRIMQRTHTSTKPPSRQRQALAWLFSLLLVLLPYTEVLKAATSLPEPMPCHQLMASGHQHQVSNCMHDLGDSGCHCCQLQAPPGIESAPIPPVALNLKGSTAPAAKVCSLPTPPITSLYRPPKQQTS